MPTSATNHPRVSRVRRKWIGRSLVACGAVAAIFALGFLLENSPPPEPLAYLSKHSDFSAAPSLAERSPERSVGVAADQAPESVAKQFLELHPDDRVAAVAALLASALRTAPDNAVKEAIRFCDLDPSYSLEYGRVLIATLAAAHEFMPALRFVLAEESDGALGENGNKWLDTLFIRWASEEPTQAAEAADTLVGPGLRGEALQAVAAGWLKKDPAALADYIWQLPPDPDRDLMFEVAFRSWTESDPSAAKAWLERRKNDE